MEYDTTHRGLPSEPGCYEIRLSGEIGERWSEWFDGLNIGAGARGTTVITGRFVDQAALHGVLRRIRDLGMPLISVTRSERPPAEEMTTADMTTEDMTAEDTSTPDGPTQLRKETS